MAPEVIKGKYSEKCDIWSCGIILFVLLSGSLPFPGASCEEILDKVEHNQISFVGPQWRNVSEDAIHFISRMLTYSPSERITAEEALKDIWIIKFSRENNVGADRVLESMNSLKEFQTQSVMQNAILTYLAGREM